MNKREALIDSVITELPDDVEDAVVDQIQEAVGEILYDMYNQFEDIRSALDEFNIENLDKIEDARKIADEMATKLY
jgi:hypothetical protein